TDAERQYDFFQYQVLNPIDGLWTDLWLPTKVEVSGTNAFAPLPIAEITDFRHALIDLSDVDYAATATERLQEKQDTLRDQTGSSFDSIMLASSMRRLMDQEFARHGLKYDCSAYNMASKTSYEVPFSTWFLHSLRLISNHFYMEERLNGSGGMTLNVTRLSSSPIYSQYDSESMMREINEWNNGKALTSFWNMRQWQDAKGIEEGALALLPRTSALQWLNDPFDPLRSDQKTDPMLEGDRSVFRFAAMERIGAGITEDYSQAGSSPVIVNQEDVEGTSDTFQEEE